ncbi:MAG: hypothetical protein MI923_29810 [Phycisphaerales bacterium]|nr:hypothetical protein [Phycisphaerales bacterium]
MQIRSTALIVMAFLGLGMWSGCAVHQPRGKGMYKYVKEPRTGGKYHLYLPVDYVKSNGRHPNYPRIKKWPLVMTFHGMKPYDNAKPQEREWEQEADIYGYVVCAPELKTSNSFMEYPLTREHSYVLKDRERVIAIMDHIFETTLADPGRVLSTSWSCGGYLAHYFPNRYPDRFRCIATRLSNFSAKLMKEDTVPLYKSRVPVGIFIGDGDFPACKTESEEAVAWYRARNFRTVRGKMIDNMGHQRIPQTAAAFFAEQLGIKPLHPIEAGKTVAKVKMTEYQPPAKLVAKMSPPPLVSSPILASRTPADRTPRTAIKPTNTAKTTRKPAMTQKPEIKYASTNAGRNYPFERGSTSRRDSKAKARPSVPATGSGTTRVASAYPTRGNWLEPIQRIGRTPRKTAAKPRQMKPFAMASTPNRRQSSNAASRKPAPPAKRTHRSKPRSAPRAVAKQDSARSNARPKPEEERLAMGFPKRRFTPKDAGSRDYDRWKPERKSTPLYGVGQTSASKSLPRPKPRSTNRKPRSTSKPLREPVSTSTRRYTGAPRTESAPIKPPPTRTKAKRVRVKLKGPAIGIAPHYLSYSVDVPAGNTEGADFLWKDNGVWMGDEPNGVKILETPGLHRITVLMVTKDNTEYRGMATVQVLDRGPSASLLGRDRP